MRQFGFVLLIIGIAILGGYALWGLWKFALAAEIPLLIRIAVVCLIVGGVVLFLTLVKERLTGKGDKYGEVEK